MKQTVFLFLFLSVFQINSFAQVSSEVSPSAETVPAPLASGTYSRLLHDVRTAFARGEERTADAVERERVQTYWEVGKLIDEHILLHKEHAEYGEEVIKRLSADLGISDTELYYMVEYARAYPIFRAPGKLTWSHYTALLRINDKTERNKLAEQAADESWSSKRIRDEITKFKAKNPSSVKDDLAEEELAPIKGKLNTYRIVSIPPLPSVGEGQLCIDLGFSNFYETTNSPARY